MCGLAGLFLPQGVSADSANIVAMVAAMRHRGPDGEGSFTSKDRRYQAGFARLAIIDLESGEQPIVEPDGHRVLMGNGEIYNYVELRGSVSGDAYPYRTQGDMEVILPLQSRYGADFVDHLNGMFAVALYEAEPHRLTLVRDRLGIKPLYWTRTSAGGIVFASEIKALFASGLVHPSVDEGSVTAYLTHGYVPAPDTLYTGVRKLPPGHRLTVDRHGEIDIDAYWQPRAEDHPARDDAERRQHLVELMRDSVRLQLRSDVPVGALLSGGLDSGMIAAMAATQMDRPLKTITVRFEGAAVDETPLAAMVAERYGTDHTEFDLASGDVADHLPRLAWFADEPLADPALLPNFLIEDVLSRTVKVALNGTGGDELFAGYGRYFPLPVERRYMALPRAIREMLIEPLVGRADAMTAWRLKRAALFGTDPGAYLHDHTTLFPPPIRDLIGHEGAVATPAQTEACRRFLANGGNDAQTALLAADMATYLPDDLLTLLDRTSMAVSVEGRVPLLDHRLVEAALAVPGTKRTPGGQQKGLMRELARDFLPAAVVDAPKQGFASPVVAWIGSGLGDLARRTLTRRETLERGWWTTAGIDLLFAAPEKHAVRIYALLMLELVVRLHVENQTDGVVPSDGLEAFADAA